MPLARGTRLGPYQIESPLGAGGMGEVYKATDTRLERTVAIKVLPAHVASDPERKQRFEREAKVISGLNHPHICTLYEFDNHEGTDFLVMEYLEGETLADRLQKGALPLDQALRYAIEIADALDKAHRQGVTHRDLKPANIMLTKAGAKLLDFGLAKLTPTGPQSDASTKLADALTEQGTILGTFQYMAPEQLEGGEADHRTDIWAFGCVVYEMVTGQKAFEGKSQASLIGAILKDEPRSLVSLEPVTPAGFDRLVRKCLSKSADARWQTSADLTDELRWIDERHAASAAESAPSQRRADARVYGPWALAAVLAVTTLALIVIPRSGEAPATGRFVTNVAPPNGVRFSLQGAELSPDGRRLAFIARRADESEMLWIRSLTTGANVVLSGTEGADRPFWSPDGRYVAYFTGDRLNRIEPEAGTVETLATVGGAVERGFHGAWAPDGTIILTTPDNRPLLTLNVDEGTPIQPFPTTVVETDRGAAQGIGTVAYIAPRFLPDGRHFLVTSYGNRAPPGIHVGSLDDATLELLVPAISSAAYLAPGWLLYVSDSRLRAQQFDPTTLSLGAQVVQIAEVEPDYESISYIFSTSATGLLAYMPRVSTAPTALTWVDREGNELGQVGEPGDYWHPRLSRDGTRLAVDLTDFDGPLGDVWVFDLERNTPTRITSDLRDESYPVWGPDDLELAFLRLPDLYRGQASGVSQPQLLYETDHWKGATDWSRDGRQLLFTTIDDVDSDVWLLDVETGAAEPWLATPAEESGARFSPDGQWVAYGSDESGRNEVYVQRFSEADDKVTISREGGRSPVWSRDGTELFFVTGSPRGVMTVPVSLDPSFRAGTPRLMFEAHLRFTGRLGTEYDVSPDGQRFLINRRLVDTTSQPLVLIQNWSLDVAESR